MIREKEMALMLHNQTLDKLSEMRLAAMHGEYCRQTDLPQTTSLSFDDRFAMVVDAEWTDRKNRQLKKLLKNAVLRIQDACLEDLDYSPEHHLSKEIVGRLADGHWIREGRTILVTGPTGTGKTYSLCAFGNAACRQGFKVRYYRVNRLLSDLSVSQGDGTYNKVMQDLKKIDVLILDDFGMTVLSPASSRDLLEVIDDRIGVKGTIMAAQLPVSHWHGVFEDNTIADAVLDRVVNNAYRFDLKGSSKRMQPVRNE